KRISDFKSNLHFRWPFSYILSWPFTPICGVYYFEKANKPSGTDYFSVFINDQGNIVPQYSTKKYDKDGYNTFPCQTIKEAIEKNEC
ncbi:hypothetical protein ACK4CH_14570, partial [Enterococcus gallinarum]